MGVLALTFIEMGALFVFSFFANVEAFYGTMIAHHTSVD